MKAKSFPNQDSFFLGPLLATCLRTLWVILVYSPWVWLFVFGLFVLGVTIQVGHLPYYGHPDPKYAGVISLLYGPTIFLLVWVLVSPILALFVLLAKRLHFPQTLEWPEVKVYLVGLALCHALPFSAIWRPSIWTVVYMYYAPILALLALLVKLQVFPRPTQWRNVAIYALIMVLFYLLIIPIGADLLDWLGD